MRGPPRRSHRRWRGRAHCAGQARGPAPNASVRGGTARSRVPVGSVEPEHDQRAVGIDTAGEAHRRIVAQGRGQQVGRRRRRRRRRRPAHGALDERGRGGVGLHEELDAELGVVVRPGAAARGMDRAVGLSWCRREQPPDGRVRGIRFGSVRVRPRHLRDEPRRLIGLGESELPGEAGHGHLTGDPGHVEVGGRRARRSGRACARPRPPASRRSSSRPSRSSRCARRRACAAPFANREARERKRPIGRPASAVRLGHGEAGVAQHALDVGAIDEVRHATTLRRTRFGGGRIMPAVSWSHARRRRPRDPRPPHGRAGARRHARGAARRAVAARERTRRHRGGEAADGQRAPRAARRGGTRGRPAPRPASLLRARGSRESPTRWRPSSASRPGARSARIGSPRRPRGSPRHDPATTTWPAASPSASPTRSSREGAIAPLEAGADGRILPAAGESGTLAARLRVDEVGPDGRRPAVRGCLDWTERRPHVAGRLGCAPARGRARRGMGVEGPRRSLASRHRRGARRARDAGLTGRPGAVARLARGGGIRLRSRRALARGPGRRAPRGGVAPCAHRARRPCARHP